jgi:glycyl-tRNA synthetase alpha subunit
MQPFLLHGLLPAHLSPDLQPRWALLRVFAHSLEDAQACVIASGYIAVDVPRALPAGAVPESTLYAGMARTPFATPAASPSSRPTRSGYGCLPVLLWVFVCLFFLIIIPPVGVLIAIGLVIYVAVREAMAFRS